MRTNIRSTKSIVSPLPFLLCLLLIGLGGMVEHMVQTHIFLPFIDILIIYYWQRFRPNHINIIAYAGLGLIQDILWGTPFAMTAITNIVICRLVQWQSHTINQCSFLVAWTILIPFVVVGVGLKVWLYGLYAIALPPIHSLTISGVITVLSFPILTLVFDIVESSLPQGKASR